MQPPQHQTVELDCPPGATRPDDLIGGVVEGLRQTPPPVVSKAFGCWTFDFSDVDAAAWQQLWLPTIEKRIVALYNSGAIRYGRWT